MCGRYYIDPDGVDEYAAEGLMEPSQNGSGVDVTPGMNAPVLVEGGANGGLRRMRWGFERPEGGLIINARVETMAQKPMFRALAERQRCAMPASRYYEWRLADRQKFDIALDGLSRFWLAGLYRAGETGNEFVVLTQPPVAAIEPVHNRMPLILRSKADLGRWLAGETRLFDDNALIRLTAAGPEQLAMRFA